MGATQAEAEVVEELIRSAFPSLSITLDEDWNAQIGFYLFLVSPDPNYTPDVRCGLPPGWRFSGWTNPEHRNAIGAVQKK